MSHRPEPWRTDRASGFDEDIHGADGPMLAHCFGEDGYLNARRIVLCVNACSGMSQQYLEELNGQTLMDKQRELIQHRDALLNLLIDVNMVGWVDPPGYLIEAVRAAIADARGKK